MYVAGTRVHLPYLDDGKGRTKEPGDKITKQELLDADQDSDDIERLRADGALFTEAEYADAEKARAEAVAKAEEQNEKEMAALVAKQARRMEEADALEHPDA